MKLIGQADIIGTLVSGDVKQMQVRSTGVTRT